MAFSQTQLWENPVAEEINRTDSD